MRDQTVVITGANSGIGAATSRALAACGAEIVMLCRDLGGAERVADEIRVSHSGAKISVYPCDLQQLASVRTAAHHVLSRHPRLTILVNNAGIYLPRRIMTADRMEATMQTNHFGPFLLTHLLLPRLLANAPARIVNVSSEAHRAGRLRWDDIHSEDTYRGFEVYGTTKLMNILHARSLASRIDPRFATINSVHPGTVATGFAQDESSLFGTCIRWLSPFLRSPTQGAQGTVFLCTHETGATTSGQYFIDRETRRPSSAAHSDADAEHLWEVSERLTGAPELMTRPA